MGIAENVIKTIAADHYMLIESALCSRFRTTKSGCSLCADACPAQAIEISDKGAEIKEGCIDCGVCYSACPNGVFRIKERDDKGIIDEIRNNVKKRRTKDEGRDFVFTISCKRGDTQADLILPCLSRLTEALLLEPVRMGVSGIEILQPSCKECPLAKASPHLQRIIQQMCYIYKLVGVRNMLHVRGCAFSPLNPQIQIRASAGSETKTLSRRELFRSFSAKAAGIAADSIPDTEQKDKGNREVFRETIQSKYENLKRSLLLMSLQEIGARGKGQVTANVFSKDAILAELEITSECTGCGVCAKLCPTGAITQGVTEDRFYLSFRPDLCTNCRVCVKTCMPGAVKIKDTVSLNLLIEQKDVVLFEAKKKICVVCKSDFIVKDSDICPLCADRHKKQTAAIQNLIKQEIIHG